MSQSPPILSLDEYYLLNIILESGGFTRLTQSVLRTRLYILSGVVGCHCLNRRGSPGSEGSEICSRSSERLSPGLQWALPGSAETLLFPLHESPRSPGMELLKWKWRHQDPRGPWMTLGPKLNYLWKVKATRHSPGGPTNTELSCCLQWGQASRAADFPWKCLRFWQKLPCRC